MPALPRALLLLGLSAGALSLAACSTPPQSQYPELSYDHLAPISFDVGVIEIEQAYKPSSEPPHVELLFPVKPGDAAAKWARDRLSAAGSSGKLRYVVSDASVTETLLEKETGLTGAVTVDQSERYEAQLVVDVEIFDDGGWRAGTATARTTRSITVPEDASLNDREQTWYELTENLMNDMNGQLETTLKKVFFQYLR